MATYTYHHGLLHDLSVLEIFYTSFFLVFFFGPVNYCLLTLLPYINHTVGIKLLVTIEAIQAIR